MTDTLKKAKAMLGEGSYTCVIIKKDEVLTDTSRGVAPLLALLDRGIDCSGASAADKVVGAGAAYLYVLLGIRELYALVISEPARAILTSHDIEVYSDFTAEHIRNRAGNGICPIERAVADARDPKDALTKIKTRLKELSEGK